MILNIRETDNMQDIEFPQVTEEEDQPLDHRESIKHFNADRRRYQYRLLRYIMESFWCVWLPGHHRVTV